MDITGTTDILPRSLSALHNGAGNDEPHSSRLKHYMNSLSSIAEAGNWGTVQNILHYRGKLLVDDAIALADSDSLAELDHLRDRLLAALDYERLHGTGSLRRMDHRLNILLERVNWRGGIPANFTEPEEQRQRYWLEDWRYFRFMAAAE